jgi:hypothetical protein
MDEDILSGKRVELKKYFLIFNFLQNYSKSM